ncbi:MAG: C39 family peptidase [Acidithiobacillus caldus]|jgi:predicted double-glycine peptidase|uniref:C39 family peptidase n=1 Tax=Acidithiobacillus caldus TaxID=33059 RepID=UPI002814CA48|nr:C39 family peptidase [Acidithiobacillus caldus]WMT46600.1 MAG: C39 family peptidase [Acidithiobacillus caldus]
MVLRSTISQILGAGSIAAALMLQSSPLFAAPFGNVIPGAGVLNIPVRSVVGMHFIHVVRQHTDFSCGAASLATILKYGFGQDVTEESVMKGLFTVSNPEEVKKVGFSLLDLKRYVEKIGLKGEGYVVPPAELENIHIPVIVLLDLGGYKHFVVLEKTGPEHVYLADPALGNRVMPKAQFLKDWNKIVFAVFGKGFEPNSVLLTPVEAPSAMRLLHGQLPKVPLQPAHFGYDVAKYF